MKKIPLTLMIMLVSLASCSALYDLWPTKIPKDTKVYADNEPNKIIWPTIGTLKDLREQCITKSILVQSELAWQMSLDKSLYARAIDQANINIQQAELERQRIVGTIQNPGWLLSFLLPSVGALAGREITKLTHYSETELKAEIAKVSNDNKTTT